VIRKLLILFLITDLLLLIIAFFVGGQGWVLNTQVAFFSSLLVTFGSFNSYKKMIEARVSTGEIPIQRDLLDEIDDKYELYDDEDKRVDEILVEEKKKALNVKVNLENLKTTAPATFSLYRIGGYFVLFASFVFLAENSLFIITPYLIGLLIVPLMTTFSLIFIK